MITDPQVAVFMLGIFIFTILLGFPICFTLVAMGVGFGYYAYWDPERMGLLKAEGMEQTFEALMNNRIFDLLVNQSYSVMANDVLTAVPLFLFMGYIVERANIVDRLFHTLYIATRRMPGSMAIAALATCAMFATATGIIGAVVTLMGLLAFPAMLKARYDTSFASGVICAGGCLGILIPPSIMLIVYSATSNVSVVKLYAGAIFPGFMLAGLYIVYVMGRSIFNPRIAPKPRPEDIPDVTGLQVLGMMVTSFFPLAFLIFSVLGAILLGLATPSEAASMGALGGMVLAISYRLGAMAQGVVKPEWTDAPEHPFEGWLYALGQGGLATLAIAAIYVAVHKSSEVFFGYKLPEEPGFLMLPGVGVALTVLIAALSRTAPDLIRRALSAVYIVGISGIVAAAIALVFIILKGIVNLITGLGIPSIAESGVGPVIGLILVAATSAYIWLRVGPAAFSNWLWPSQRSLQRAFAFAGKGVGWGLFGGAVYTLMFTVLGLNERFADHEFNPLAFDIGLILGLVAYFAWKVNDQERLRESIYLTVRTSAMVCWLFVGSWTFASVFSYLGGEKLIESFVLSMDLSPVMFLILAQIIIFLLGWPLEWSEIIIIFVPIFLPLLPHFGIDPLFFGILVALNLQTSFLTPPMAMSAYYLKGIAPPHVQLVQIFKGCFPFLVMVFISMAVLYIFPGIALYLPDLIYGR
jgi:TRAP-type mannitol/chloroaromatic compound transport system permease large subunit